MFEIGLTAIGAPILFAPSSAFAKADRQLMEAFAGAPVVSASELDKQRGGFMLSNGAMVNFGMEVQQFVNNTLQNDTTINQVNNQFIVTQTTPNGTTQAPLTAAGLSVTTLANNGATKLVTTMVNGSIQTVVQNAANNQALKTVTTLNISTQGLQNVLHQVSMNAQVMNALHMSSWMHH